MIGIWTEKQDGEHTMGKNKKKKQVWDCRSSMKDDI